MYVVGVGAVDDAVLVQPDDSGDSPFDTLARDDLHTQQQTIRGD